MPKRCPRGTRKNKKTGVCEPYTRGTGKTRKSPVPVETETRYPIISVKNKGKKIYTKIAPTWAGETHLDNFMDYCIEEYGEDWQIHYEEIEALIEPKVLAQVPAAHIGQNGGELLFDEIPVTKKLKSFTFSYLDKLFKVEWNQ